MCSQKCWLLFGSTGSKNAPAIVLVTLQVAGSKKCTRDTNKVTTMFMGSKKYTCDISEVTIVPMGLKQCIHESVWLLFESSGSKKCTRDVSKVATISAGSKKCIHEDVWLLFESSGSKKCTRDSVSCSSSMWVQSNVSTKIFGYSLGLRVQKNAPAIVLVAL